MSRDSVYSAEFKEQLLAKVFSPGAPSIAQLAKNANIPCNTLYTWLHKHKTATGAKLPAVVNSQTVTTEHKLKAIADTLSMGEVERNVYCRKQGLYIHHLAQWKQQIMANLGANNKGIDAKKYQAENRLLTTENKQLKQELRRKEKALAEASALLILKKKADCVP